MEEKSYFEAMFGELSNGDGGNTFSLPNKNFISPPRLTQKNKEKLKEAYEKAHEIRKFEIDLGSCLAEPFMIGFKARYANEKQVCNSFKNF